MAREISVATLELAGFSQVLLASLLLQVAVDEEESLVLDEPRPTTRLGNQARLALSSSDMAAIRLPMGTRGPIKWPWRRASISSIFYHSKEAPAHKTRLICRRARRGLTGFHAKSEGFEQTR